jgi:acetolactate synthase-1/2/3 large subunit
MPIKVTDYIAGRLFDKGVRQVFQLSGGMITHLLDSLEVQQQIQIVSVHHEQAAAFAVDACGRMTGIPGVAMATSGPGAINLLTGIGSCYFDSSPAVFITGQVNRNEQKRELKIRQLGFQETDIVAMAAPITKAAWRVETPEEVPDLLERAFSVAISGRAGPVLLDIPMDVQRSLLDAPVVIRSVPTRDTGIGPDAGSLRALRSALETAKRPLLLVGGGIRASRAMETFRQLVDTLGIPVVHSLMAVDALPFGHPLRVGMIGSYGNRWANLALSQSDLLLVLGSRLDVRQTGSRTDAFRAGRTIFHVDCEESEINNRVKGCEVIVSELAEFLPRFLDETREIGAYLWERHRDWSREIAALRTEWPDTRELAEVPGINPNQFMHDLSGHASKAAAFVADVGQHQMWAAQSLELVSGQRFMTSGGMGSMGFGLPAAIGAAFSAPGRPIVLIAGDGGFQCNIQELQTVARLNLPIKIVVLNNQCHGMVRQFQESYFQGRYPATYWGYSAPDFARVASAYGLCGMTATDPEHVAEMLVRLWEEPGKPILLQVMIDTFANAYPKIAFGKPISEMEPFSEPIEMEST